MASAAAADPVLPAGATLTPPKQTTGAATPLPPSTTEQAQGKRGPGAPADRAATQFSPLIADRSFRVNWSSERRANRGGSDDPPNSHLTWMNAPQCQPQRYDRLTASKGVQATLPR